MSGAINITPFFLDSPTVNAIRSVSSITEDNTAAIKGAGKWALSQAV